MYSVGIIGLGRIAATYAAPEHPHPYCHAGGVHRSDRTRLVAVADPSQAARDGFASVWGGVFPDVRYFNSARALFGALTPDIVAVCVRGPQHYEVVMEATQAGARAVFLEKPPSCSLAELDRMVAAAGRRAVPITVSYSRHWSPPVMKLQELVQGGLIGPVKTVVGYGGGRVLSDASHTTDLICQFAGYGPAAVSARGDVSGEAPPGYEPEPLLHSMVVEFENGVTGLQVGSEGDYGGFYCEVFGTEGRLRVGMYTPPVLHSPRGEVLDLTPLELPEPASVFSVAYDQIADYLAGGPLPHCTGPAATAVHEVGFAAIESMVSDRRVPLPNRKRDRRVFANG